MIAKRKHPMLIVANNLWSGYRTSLIGYWIIFVAIFVGIHLGLPINMSKELGIGEGIWAGASISPKIYLLVIGILLTPVSLSSFVSSGITRKHFVGGAMLFTLLMSLISAIVMVVGFPVERLLTDWFGGQEILVTPPLLQSGVEFFLGFLGYFAIGWMIGSGFYRFSWQSGIAISILSLVPIIFIEMVSGTGPIELFGYTMTRPSVSFMVEMLLVLLIVCIIMALNYGMHRTVAIKRKLI
ncbi:hypothetical protein D3P07_15035 [Paenibacillus sp. 1011MAR3C5]|uniref:hypothetical protein n=1 Tax=Paenibacillus sp. 1011MAR3C5 TaxID=1675787 RepID=UPI000E6C30E4|nr:hypothetical protein [Paenibacillus sp. 1011MAR3C5]RJE87629.1 hypothetical protein D3P07_15035 [Paenibacillus sp. 1011MAR3C5]